MRLRLTLLLLVISTAVGAIEGRLGYRRDHIAWSIGLDQIDILSELKWRNLNILEASIYAQPSKGWCVGELLASGGWIFSGEDRDCDYVECRRSVEFARSHAKADGYVIDLRGAIGKARWRGATRQLFWLGVTYNRQKVCSFAGVDELLSIYDLEGHLAHVINVAMPFEDDGVNAHYAANWVGPFVGVTLELPKRGKWSYAATGRLHNGLLCGRGDWPMREFDYFSQLAYAWGISGEFKGLLCLSRCLELGLSVHGSYWATAEGSSHTHADGEKIGRTRLNRVQWSSFGSEIVFRVVN